MRVLLAALALLVAAYVAPAVSFADNQQAALAPGRHLHTFRCPQSLLRVVFDGDRNIVIVYRFGHPPVTLSGQSGGEGFHFSNATYDLQGTYEEVRFRIGQGAAARCVRNAANG